MVLVAIVVLDTARVWWNVRVDALLPRPKGFRPLRALLVRQLRAGGS